MRSGTLSVIAVITMLLLGWPSFAKDEPALRRRHFRSQQVLVLGMLICNGLAGSTKGAGIKRTGSGTNGPKDCRDRGPNNDCRPSYRLLIIVTGFSAETCPGGVCYEW
ncbi:MAG: hypothetical protein Ct9H300mP25_08120 [Acidobacteriota bacterium]|nr:MAG: hypothetical protein Ct9H300mP25_08120 [Acidobacteriota bacterium]